MKTSNKIPQRKPRAGDFVKIYETKNSKWRSVYFGKLTSVSKDCVSALVTEESEPGSIFPENFNIPEYTIEMVCESDVVQYFTCALHARKRKVEEVTFDLDNEKRRLERTKMGYDNAFPSQRF